MKPLLAATIKDDQDLAACRFPLFVSRKIDGIRCLIVDGEAKSRSLKPIANRYLNRLLSVPELNGLDGELVVKGGTFQETTSAVMAHDGEPEVTFCVFDWFTLSNTTSYNFLERYEFAAKKVKDYNSNRPLIRVELVEQKLVGSLEEVLDFEKLSLSEGFEGVMLRGTKGDYKFGRSTLREGILMKLKRFSDAECTVIGFEERQHNANEAFTDELGRTKRSSAQAGKIGMNTLGAFLVRGDDGVEFSVGSGLTDEQRAKWWGEREALLGKKIKVKSLPIGKLLAPRHPVFLGFRDERDL